VEDADELFENLPKDFHGDDNSTVPPAHDWRNQGIVTDVKSQGSCGSCWAFAAVGSMESIWAKETGELLNLSVQQLIDCGPGDCVIGG